VNIVIPMAGQGRRFVEAGYVDPKPLIDCGGRTMIDRVAASLPKGRLIILHNLPTGPAVDRPSIRVRAGQTGGAACTVLLASLLIDNDEPLLIANCDQLVDWQDQPVPQAADGWVATFTVPDRDRRWSYVSTNGAGWIDKVAEKNPISDTATSGLYYWRHGSDFCHYARKMIDRDARVNGEFYVAPVYQEAIRDGKRFVPYPLSFHDMGTPEALNLTAKELRW